MLEPFVRRIPALILSSVTRLAPREARDWGMAMLGELNHVEGYWAGLAWALGGAAVLAKCALTSLFIPNGGRQPVPGGGIDLGKEVSMRRSLVIAGGLCLVAAALFFAAPAFRQGFRLSLAPWSHVLQLSREASLEELAKRVERNHDPEGMAFAAARVRDDSECARLAEEAVRLDPKLIWVYAVVAGRHPGLPEVEQWLPKLEQSDAQNALFHLIAAERADIAIGSHAQLRTLRQEDFEQNPAWQAAMTSAFQSPEFDDYLDRLRELDRTVVTRYGFNDPLIVLNGEDEGLPSYALSDSLDFGNSVVKAGQVLATRGDSKRAEEKYWSVARFGQAVDSHGRTDSEHILGLDLQAQAFKAFQALSEKEGNPSQAAVYGYLQTRSVEGSRERWHSIKLSYRGGNASYWSGLLVKISGMLILLFGALALISLMTVIAARRKVQPSLPRERHPAAALGLIGAVGLLLSSTMLYVIYQPYSEIFSRFLSTGDTTHLEDLSTFLVHTQLLPGESYFASANEFVVDFWAGVILLGFMGLSIVAVRHLRARRQASAHA